MIHVPTATWVHPIFDAIAWSAGLATSVALYRWRLRDQAARVAAKVGPGYFVALCAGAVPVAWLSGSLNTMRDGAPTLSHSVAGALVGAIFGVEIYKRLYRIEGSTGGLFVGSFTIGVAIGRWGCLFAGLPDETYGIPTTLPWGVDLGDGIARHPVQIYESLAMAGFFAVYLTGLARRQQWALTRAFYLMCFWYGLQRFVWEFMKPYPRLVGPLNIFQLLCLGLMAYAMVYDRKARAHDQEHARRDADGRAVSLPRADDEPLRDLPLARAGEDHRGG